MAFNPYQPISQGQSDTTQINGPIDGLSKILTGFGQSAIGAAVGILPLSTTPADTGAAVTVTITGTNAFAIVTGVFDFDNDVLSAGNVAIGTLVLNGSTQTGEAHLGLTAAARASVVQMWRVPLPAGSNNLRTQASKTGGASVAHTNPTHTTITAAVFDVP